MAIPRPASVISVPALRGILAAVLAVAVAAGGLRGQEPAEESEYALRPGDQVQITVFTAAGDELEQVAGERIVDRRGRLFLPLVGTLSVEGMSAAEIRQALVRRFAEFYDNPVVDVTVRLKVNVTGAVQQPGHYFLAPTATVVDALATAGGTGTQLPFTATGTAADPSQVRIVRGGEQIILDLRPEEADEETVNFPVQSGDWIYVPPRTRSQLRDNLNFASSILTVVGSLAGIIILFTR